MFLICLFFSTHRDFSKTTATNFILPNEPIELRTVHVDNVNEIIRLASGSKNNIESKDQLI